MQAFNILSSLVAKTDSPRLTMPVKWKGLNSGSVHIYHEAILILTPFTKQHSNWYSRYLTGALKSLKQKKKKISLEDLTNVDPTMGKESPKVAPGTLKVYK